VSTTSITTFFDTRVYCFYTMIILETIARFTTVARRNALPKARSFSTRWFSTRSITFITAVCICQTMSGWILSIFVCHKCHNYFKKFSSSNLSWKIKVRSDFSTSSECYVILCESEYKSLLPVWNVAGDTARVRWRERYIECLHSHTYTLSYCESILRTEKSIDSCCDMVICAYFCSPTYPSLIGITEIVITQVAIWQCDIS
jgi:hypothetical protein